VLDGGPNPPQQGGGHSVQPLPLAAAATHLAIVYYSASFRLCQMHEMQTVVTDDPDVCLSVSLLVWLSVTWLNSTSLCKNSCSRSRSCLG